MKHRITLVLSLMCFCTLGLLGFQSYWSYQAYVNATRSFKTDINQALEAAILQEGAHRRSLLAEKYRAWISDTSMILICTYVDPVYKMTHFYMQDVYPPYPEKVGQPFVVSFDNFTQLVPDVTPGARNFFIKQFVEGPLRKELENGWVSYFTQRLGDSLNHALGASKVDLKYLRPLYRAELAKREIEADFRLALAEAPLRDTASFPHATEPFWTYGKFPVGRVKAWFPDPNLVFLGRMKWVLLSSLLLTSISLYCFSFTVTTLLRQKKFSELKNDFVNNMTHELKTPVATIGVAAEAIQHYGLDKADNEEYAGIIREQAGNLSRLIDQILRSAIEEEQMALDLEKICLPSLVDTAVGQLKPLIEKRGARVDRHLAEGTWVRGSRIHLGNVIVNLLDNALKYSAAAPVITIASTVEKDAVLLHVSDNGIGIEERYQDKVFDRFFRVPTGNVHTVKGYGLGLSYAKSVVEKHQGTLTLQSREGHGTRITIQIPLYPHGSATHPAPRR